MKKLVVLVVLLVLVLGVAPWGVGKLVEGRVNKGLDTLVVEAPYLTIVERKWTGGWFRSEQEVTFELFGKMLNALRADAARSAPAATGGEVAALRVVDELTVMPMPESADATEPAAPPAEPAPALPKFPEHLRITVKNEIFHGPVLWTSGIGLAEVRTKVVLDESIRKALLDAVGTDEPVRMKTRVGLFGGGTTTFYGEARDVKPKSGGSISWEAFKLAVHYSGNLDSIGMKGAQPRIEIKNEGGKTVVVRDASVDMDIERIVGDLYDTDFKMALGEVTGVDASNKPFTVEDVHYFIDTDKKGDFIDIGVKLGSGEFKSSEIDQIGVKLKEVHYDFSFHRLHAETLARLSTKIKESYSKPVDASTPEAVDSAFLAPLKDDAISLFKHDPEIGIDRLGIVTAEGEGVIKGLVKFKGVTAADFDNPMSIVGKLDVELNAEVPQRMIEKFPNGSTMSGAAVDAGYMKRVGDNLICKITFKNGTLLVNGKPQAIPGMGGPPPEGAGMDDRVPDSSVNSDSAESAPAPKE